MKPPIPADGAMEGVLNNTRGAALAVAAGGVLSVALAFVHPLLGLVPAVLAVVVAGGAYLMQRPWIALQGALFGFVLVVVAEEGINPFEAVYVLYFVAFTACWYAGKLLTRQRLARSAGDYAAGTWLVLGFTLGPVMGLLYGATLGYLIANLTTFWLLLLYFPVKEAFRTQERASEIVIALLFVLGLYVSVRIFLNFREILLAATVDWQIADARPGYNALQLVSGSVAALVLLVHLRKWNQRALLIGALAIMLAALVLIKYRGFWVSALFSFFVVFLLLQRSTRRRLVLMTLLGGGILAGLGWLVLGPTATMLLVEGVVNRFATLQTAVTDDISLINRFTESRTVLGHVAANPILGHGFGTEYYHYSMIYMRNQARNHIHIGYVDMIYRMGLWGFFLSTFLWVRTVLQGLRLFRSPLPPAARYFALVVGATLAGMVFSVITESPWFLKDQFFVFVLFVAGVEGLRQRLDDQQASGRPAGPR